MAGRKSSDDSVSLFEVLLLVQLLRERLLDLRTAPLESLERSVVGPGGRRRRRSRKVADALIAQAKKAAGLPVRAPDLDVVRQGLEATLFVPVDPVAPVGFPAFEAALRRFTVAVRGPFPKSREKVIPTTALPVAVPRPVPPPARKPSLLERTERGRELACVLAAPFLMQGTRSGDPRIMGASLVALAGCGFELFDVLEE